MQIQTNTTPTLLYELQQLLIQIKTCNDLNTLESQHSAGLLTQHGLKLLHYALFAIETNQTQLELTTINAGAAMCDVLHELSPLAKTYGAELRFWTSSNLEPVYADTTSLKGSIYALLTGIITSTAHSEQPIITLAVQQTKPSEQRIGIYSNTTPIQMSVFKNNKNSSPQRMDSVGTSYRSGLGFLVSQILAGLLNTSYSSFEHRQIPGVGFYLPESAQLQFI